jgi:hypothetical protein
MNRKWLFVLALLLPALVFTSCDSFFSSTWGSARSYDSSNINLTLGNLEDWRKAAIGNPALAAAVTKKIRVMVSTMGDGPEKAVFQEAGVQEAIESSGIGVSLLGNAADVLGEIDDLEGEKAVTDLLTNIRDDFNSGGGPQAAADIAGIISGNITGGGGGGTPTLTGAYADTAKPGDVGQAVLVLALAVFGDADIEETIDGIGDGSAFVCDLKVDGNEVKVDNGASLEAQALAAYLNLIAGDTSGKFGDNLITNAIKEAFKLDT